MNNADARIFSGRRLAVVAAVLFSISWVFPVVAGLSKNTASFPKWWGRLDVGLAFLLAVLALVIMAIAGGKVDKQAEDATYRAYRFLIHGILAMSVVFFLFGYRSICIRCLTGFAWRTWLLLYSLPAWFAALRNTTGTNFSPRGSSGGVNEYR